MEEGGEVQHENLKLDPLHSTDMETLRISDEVYEGSKLVDRPINFFIISGVDENNR